MFNQVRYQWDYLTGKIPVYEIAFLVHLCNKGVSQSALLSVFTKNDGGSASIERAGKTEALRLMRTFLHYNEFRSTWDALSTGITEATLGFNNSMSDAESKPHVEFYWRLKGQQAQMQFVLERLLVFREMQNGYRFDARPIPIGATESVISFVNSLSNIP